MLIGNSTTPKNSDGSDACVDGNGLAKRHEVSRNLVRIWVTKYEANSFDSDVVAADMVQTQEGRIAALERLVGKLARKKMPTPQNREDRSAGRFCAGGKCRR